MTDLVACISSGEKGLAHVAKLVESQEWKNVFLIANEESKSNFKCSKKVNFVVVDFQKPVSELIEDIRKSLDGKIYDLDVALNMVSGTGKEHMAILSALLKLGLGIRLMAVTKNGVVEL
ncbi:MAG: hypothetical protein AABX00_01710 [Nanoarchaeota archaeon]